MRVAIRRSSLQIESMAESDTFNSTHIMIPSGLPSSADVSPASADAALAQAQRQLTYFGRIRLILYTQIFASAITGLSAACDTQRLELPEPLEIALASLTIAFLPLMLIAFPVILYFLVRVLAPLSIRMAILIAAGMSTALHWIAAVPLVQ